MATGDQYRVKSADMHAKAMAAINPEMRDHFESLALAYLRLADQADRREAYEHPAETHPAHPTQQQERPPRRFVG